MRCADAVRAFFLSSSSFPSSSLSFRVSLSRLLERTAREETRRLLSEIWNLCLQKSLLGVHSFCISHHECDHHSRKKTEGNHHHHHNMSTGKSGLFSLERVVVNRRPLLKDTNEWGNKKREKCGLLFSSKKKSQKKKKKKCFRETNF